MPVLALRLTALAALAISVSGCVMEAYGSRARSDAQSWIGLPIQDVIKRFGEPERVTGDAARQKYVWKEYENYSHDYDYTYYEQGHGNTPNSSVLNQKTGTANQSGYYTCIYEFFADASGRVVDWLSQPPPCLRPRRDASVQRGGVPSPRSAVIARPPCLTRVLVRSSKPGRCSQ